MKKDATPQDDMNANQKTDRCKQNKFKAIYLNPKYDDLTEQQQKVRDIYDEVDVFLDKLYVLVFCLALMLDSLTLYRTMQTKRCGSSMLADHIWIYIFNKTCTPDVQGQEWQEARTHRRTHQ